MPKFDPEKEKNSNNNMRIALLNMKAHLMQFVDPNNGAAVRKAEHYLAALDGQLQICDNTDETIDWLCQPFPAHRHLRT